MAATLYGDDSPHLSWKCAHVTGKAGESGQNSGEMGGSSPWTRPSAPECGNTLQGSGGRPASDLGWGSSSKTAPGSLSTGSPASRTPPHGDGPMYSQANVRAGKVLRLPIRALPSVIVVTEKGDAGRRWARWKDQTRRKRTPSFPSNESSYLEECSEVKEVDNYLYTSVPMVIRLKTVSRPIISVNQLSLYGAGAEMCEEYESFHDRTEKPVVGGQSNPSFVPNVMKTNILLTDDPAQEEDLLQRHQERIEKLSQQDQVIKFATDAGFLTTVEDFC